MDLIEFIKFIKDENDAMSYMEKHHPDIDYYDAEVYAEGSISATSSLAFFDGEKIEGRIEMKVNDKKYYNLFTLDLLVEVCTDYYSPDSTDVEIAEKIISYRINDA